MSEWWGRLESWGKAHPVALGLIVFAIGAIIIYLVFGGSSSSSASTAGDQTAADYYAAQAQIAASGNQLQAAQLAAASTNDQTAASLQAYQSNLATQLQIATTNSQTELGVASIDAQAQDQQTAATQESADLASTLNAKVAQAGFDTQQNITALNDAAATATAQINANASIANTNTNAAVNSEAIMAQLYGTAGNISQQVNAITGGMSNITLSGPMGTFVAGSASTARPSITGLQQQGYTLGQAQYLAGVGNVA